MKESSKGKLVITKKKKQRRRKNKEPRTGCGIRLERELQTINLAVRIAPQPKQAAEITALIIAIQNTPGFAPLHIKTFTTELPTLEQKEWFDTPNAALLWRRSARTALQWFGKKNIGTEIREARNVARRAMTKPTVTEIPTEIPDRFNLTGAELSAITQASAYQAIRETKGTDHTGTTESNIVAVEEGIQNLSGFRPEAHQIWRVLRD